MQTIYARYAGCVWSKWKTERIIRLLWLGCKTYFGIYKTTWIKQKIHHKIQQHRNKHKIVLNTIDSKTPGYIIPGV